MFSDTFTASVIGPALGPMMDLLLQTFQLFPTIKIRNNCPQPYLYLLTKLQWNHLEKTLDEIASKKKKTYTHIITHINQLQAVNITAPSTI